MTSSGEIVMPLVSVPSSRTVRCARTLPNDINKQSLVFCEELSVGIFVKSVANPVYSPKAKKGRDFTHAAQAAANFVGTAFRC